MPAKKKVAEVTPPRRGVIVKHKKHICPEDGFGMNEQGGKLVCFKCEFAIPKS